MKNQDWKLKYSDLKLRFHDAVDVSFRLGFEAGAQGAQLQQMQQAQAATQQSAMQSGQDVDAQMEPEQSDGSELDQHIGTLQNMLQSSKPGSSEEADLQKSLSGIKAFQLGLKQASDLKKSEKAINDIGKAMKAPFTLSTVATKNLNESDKKALTMQERIVADMMKSIEEEEKHLTESINKTLSFEQILKG